jgi:hypothetical protein
VFTASHPVAEREYCGRYDEVQRKEEKSVLLAQSNGNSERSNAQEHDRDDRRVTRQGNCDENRCDNSHADEPDACRLGEEESEVVVTDERTPDARRSKPEEREAGEWQQASTWDQHEHGAERADERGNLSSVRVLHGWDVTRWDLVVE